MPKLIIQIEFKNDSDLEVALDNLSDQALSNVYDYATTSSYGPCWLGDDYQVYLMPEEYDLGIELVESEEDEF